MLKLALPSLSEIFMARLGVDTRNSKANKFSMRALRCLKSSYLSASKFHLRNSCFRCDGGESLLSFPLIFDGALDFSVSLPCYSGSVLAWWLSGKWKFSSFIPQFSFLLRGIFSSAQQFLLRYATPILVLHHF